MKTKRSRACDIPRRVKEAVWERDKGCCIVCGSPEAMPNAHYISRAHGGLGIENNIVTLCRTCHDKYDNGTGDDREIIGRVMREYLQEHYPDWDEQNLVYKKGEIYELFKTDFGV